MTGKTLNSIFAKHYNELSDVAQNISKGHELKDDLLHECIDTIYKKPLKYETIYNEQGWTNFRAVFIGIARIQFNGIRSSFNRSYRRSKQLPKHFYLDLKEASVDHSCYNELYSTNDPITGNWKLTHFEDYMVSPELAPLFHAAEKHLMNYPLNDRILFAYWMNACSDSGITPIHYHRESEEFLSWEKKDVTFTEMSEVYNLHPYVIGGKIKVMLNGIKEEIHKIKDL